MIRKQRVILLSKIPYGDRDLIVTLLSEEGVRLSAFAPAARSSRRRFGGSLDLFNRLDVLCVEPRADRLFQLKEAEVVLSGEEVRKDLIKFGTACYFTEMILHFLQESEKAPLLYESFCSFLDGLNEPRPFSTHVIPLLEDHFLRLFGYQPELMVCLHCSKSIKPTGDYFFHGMKGGLLCALCLDRDKVRWKEKVAQGKKPMVAEPNGAYPLSYGAIKKILEGRGMAPPRWDRLQWSSEEVFQVRRALEYFIQYTVGKPFKSLQFLSHIAGHL